MDTEQMIRELRYLENKHKDDRVCTFGTRWADVCHDVANRLEDLNKDSAFLNFIENHMNPNELQKYFNMYESKSDEKSE